MKRKVPLVRRTPLQPRSKRSAHESSTWVRTRRAILDRDGHRCRRCMSPAHHVHHVLPRSRGGRNDGSTPLIVLCAGCHDWVHRHPQESRAAGWLV